MNIKFLFLLLLTAGIFGNVSAQKIACGSRHSLIVCADSMVWAWGANNYGQLGDGTTDSNAVPAQVQGLSGIVAVACGLHNSFAIDVNGDLWAWGYNDYYALGIDTFSHFYTPQKVSGISKVRKIFSDGESVDGLGGQASTYAITEDGSLWAWGFKSPLLPGSSDFYFSETPVKDTILQNVVGVGGGSWAATLVLLEDGTVLAWSNNTRGAMGVGQGIGGSDTLMKVTDNVKVLSSEGVDYALTLKNDGTLWAWGYNSFGQLGDSTNSNRYLPVQIKGISNVKQLYASFNSSSYAILEDETLWAWGFNNFGQLGDGTIDNRNYPAPVNGISDVMAVAAGSLHALAVTSDGKLWSWGRNHKGQLGDGTFTDKHTPAQVQGICDILVSVPEITLNTTEYKIYPNPATNVLHIDFTTITPNKIEVQDIHGRTLYSQSVSPAQSTHEVSLADFASGVYFVKLYSNEGVVLKKVVRE